MNAIKNRVGEKLRRIRTLNNLTQLEMANNLNISKTAYSDYERSKKSIPIEVLVRFATNYKISLDTLFFEKDTNVDNSLMNRIQEIESKLNNIGKILKT